MYHYKNRLKVPYALLYKLQTTKQHPPPQKKSNPLSVSETVICVKIKIHMYIANSNCNALHRCSTITVKF
jgi:hypothetical protein